MIQPASCSCWLPDQLSTNFEQRDLRVSEPSSSTPVLQASTSWGKAGPCPERHLPLGPFQSSIALLALLMASTVLGTCRGLENGCLGEG